ncbi:hypothetical protein BGZ49_005118, partial [Haplosporangium sp. Z 27]
PKRDRDDDDETNGESSSKHRRLSQEYRILYTDHRGKQALLPRFLVDMLRDNSHIPDPRHDFSELLNVKEGDQIKARSLGQAPKFFARGVQGNEFIISEQMMELWTMLDNDDGFSITKCLSGPMGVGKSYIAWFLAAKAYSHGWPVLYIPDAGDLQECTTKKQAAIIICQRFISLNKDILTLDELASMVKYEDKDMSLEEVAARYVLKNLLQQERRKTLFIIDEHGALFPPEEKEKSVTNKFPLLRCLNNFNSWMFSKGARVIFTGTAHGKFERTILRDQVAYLIHVGPLSPLTFDKLFDATLANLDEVTRVGLKIRKDTVIKITNRVPRDLITLVSSIAGKQSMDKVDSILAAYATKCLDTYAKEASTYFNNLKGYRRDGTIQALTKMFLPGRKGEQPGTFEWEFLDSGMIYQSESEFGAPEYRPINLSAQKAIMNLYKTIPLPESLRSALASGHLDGNQFQEALFRELIKGPSHIFQSTDLAGGNKNDI